MFEDIQWNTDNNTNFHEIKRKKNKIWNKFNDSMNSAGDPMVSGKRSKT